MPLSYYLTNINRRYRLGNATEHTFRGDLQQLIEGLVPDIRATNEPKRQSCGAPDYILTKKDIPVGFIEAKDIGDKDLDGARKSGNKEQFDRYKASLSNLIFTDYLNFHLYRDGQFITSIAIAEQSGSGIRPLPQNFSSFVNLIQDFCAHIGQTIKSSKKLAEMMAGKARLLSDVLEKALTSDAEQETNSSLQDQMLAFRQILIHDITPKGFADVYAQTLAYGMFAARLHDPTLPTFSRQEAAELIPRSNPFLRRLFGYIAGPDIDDRIKWIMDSLVEIFLACNVAEILKNYGKSTQMEDPIIHFYETFLSEYDPKLRKARGVWYTPAPVVGFIVRAVDEILKTEFDLPHGLADTGKTKIKITYQGKKAEREVHKVQILDPATGTGTFLAEVVKHIYQGFVGQQGIWSNYVETHLLPRLNGFELLMASYAMAHLQLDLLLARTGYKPTREQRLRVYLTNSLEEHHPDTGTLFASWLSAEANEANHIKRDTPVMCVIGNPPYSVSSSNKSQWIQNLVADYKKDLNERKINLDDDYIKFIRYGQYFVDKNGSGILAYISNNSFIDGITHRQMRKHLLESFDQIYILDLHGSTKKKETCSNGSPDQNVFDIMQGVSINLFVKTGKKKKNTMGQVFYADLQGKREVKYDFMNVNSLQSIEWQQLEYKKPYYFFVPKDFSEEKGYGKGFKLNELFLLNNTGIQTKRDGLVYNFTIEKLEKTIKDILELPNQIIQQKYCLPEDGRDWTIDFARNDLSLKDGVKTEVAYHPFDNRSTYFTARSKGFMAYPRSPLSKNCIQKNISLLAVRNSRTENNGNYFIANKLVDKDCVSPLDNCKFFPLYIYPDSTAQQTLTPITGRTPNLNPAIVQLIAEKLGLSFVNESLNSTGIFLPPPTPPNIGGELDSPLLVFKEGVGGGSSRDRQGTFAPIDLLDYIYAVLHSPTYREKYKEFLKIDFPRVPYPDDKDSFWRLVSLGGELRQIHLLESPVVAKFITQYPVDGDNVVRKPRYQDGKVFINDSQYFAGVPEIAWNFYIGGYQPAQKWLKDRKERKLEFDDIQHYQKIIVALSETHRIMKEITNSDGSGSSSVTSL
jgi:predicted helicase